jgi:hypothetical protein
MLSATDRLYARALEIAEPDIATTGRLRAILDTARTEVAALPPLHGPWPVQGWDAETTAGMLLDLTPGIDAAGLLHDHALEYARAEQSAGP